MPACPAGSVQQQVMQQYSYLFQMAQQLNLALEQLEQGERGTGDAAQAERRYRKLRRLIAAAAERSGQALTALLAGAYVSAADFGQCAEALSAAAEASPEEAERYGGAVTPLQQRMAALERALVRCGQAACVRAGIVRYDGETPVYGAAVGQALHCRETADGTVIEQAGFRAVFTADGLSFWQDAAEVAHVAAGRLQVTELTADGVTVGAWSVRSSGGGLAVRWIGGQT